MTPYKRPTLIGDTSPHHLRREVARVLRDALPEESPEELADRVLDALGTDLETWEAEAPPAGGVFVEADPVQGLLDEVVGALGGELPGDTFRTAAEQAGSEVRHLAALMNTVGAALGLDMGTHWAEDVHDEVKAALKALGTIWAHVVPVLQRQGVQVGAETSPLRYDPDAVDTLTEALDGLLQEE